MRALKIIVLSLLGLFIAAIMALVIFVKFYDFNRYKPAIIAQAKSALNRDIDFDRIIPDISFGQGVSLKITNLKVAEDPSFKSSEFLSVKEISLGINPLSYIFQRKIDINKILIDSPRLTIIRLKDGSINAATLARPAQPGNSGQNKNTVKEPAPAVPAALALPDIRVSYLRVDRCAVKYIDRSMEPELSVDIPDLYVSLSNISLTDPFPFIVEVSVVSKNRNIKFEGKAQFNAATGEVTISGMEASTDLSELKIEKIPEAFPMTKGAVLPELLEGIVNIRFDAITAGPKGLGALKGTAAAAKGVVQFKELIAPVKNISAQAVLTQSDILLDSAYLTVGTGMIKLSGSLNDYPAKQSYAMAMDIENIKIQNLLDQKKAPVKLEGTVSGPVKVQGEGFTPEALKSSLSATADILIAKPRLRDLNVLQAVLDKISVIPGLSENIEASLPDKYKQKLTQKDTAFADIKLPLNVKNGRIMITDAVIAGDEFTFKGKAEAGFDAAYSLEGSFLIAQDLSGAMVAAVSQLKYLLNDAGQIYIPLKVSGKAGQVNFIVDANYIGKKLLENQAKQQIFKALDKALGGSGVGNIFK
jgi:uncharacterized protein involved in outer membrane biogenesis